ncbi:hypothetical protein GCM10017687_17220 [Streptomyces echinatus]|uniref:streptophobe family protein n=1 Tax=Streptomyces echinatus TaxID=67293 RepID=UPI003385ECE0
MDTSATLLGGLGWCAGVLLVALLAARRAPLPPGWAVVHRVVRPAASALVTVLLVAVAAGLAAAAYAAIGDDHPRRIAGAALLGAPNGVWLGVPLGLFVPWDGKATGVLVTLLPHPMDQLLAGRSGRPVTVGRLAGLDGRVWLLAVAAVLMILLAGVLTAVRTPLLRTPAGRSAADHTPVGRTPVVRPAGGALGFAGRCALRLGVATALTLPLLAWLTDVSVNAALSVLGLDVFGAGLDLHGRLGPALLLGAAWGAGAGAVGALLAWTSGAAGTRAVPAARVGAAVGAGAAGDAPPGAGCTGAGGRGGPGRGSVGASRWFRVRRVGPGRRGRRVRPRCRGRVRPRCRARRIGPRRRAGRWRCRRALRSRLRGGAVRARRPVPAAEPRHQSVSAAAGGAAGHLAARRGAGRVRRPDRRRPPRPRATAPEATATAPGRARAPYAGRRTTTAPAPAGGARAARLSGAVEGPGEVRRRSARHERPGRMGRGRAQGAGRTAGGRGSRPYGLRDRGVARAPGLRGSPSAARRGTLVVKPGRHPPHARGTDSRRQGS